MTIVSNYDIYPSKGVFISVIFLFCSTTDPKQSCIVEFIFLHTRSKEKREVTFHQMDNRKTGVCGHA